MYRGLIIFSVILAGFFICGVDSDALTIGPARLEVRLPAGEVAGIDYYAQNDTEAPVHVTVEPENWFVNSYDYKGLKAGDWIKAEPREFDLNPKEIKKVFMTVRVPKKAKGELAGQIFFTSTPANAPEGGGNMRSRLGAVLYVAIKDTEKVSARIRDIAVTGLQTDSKKQLKVSVNLHNDGNVHIRPAEGSVAIADDKGHEIAKLKLSTDYGVVPGEEFAYTVSWDNPALEKGKYKLSAFIKYGKMFAKEKVVKSEKIFEVNHDGKVIAK